MKGRWLVALMLVGGVALGGTASAQEPAQPPPAPSDVEPPLGDEEAMVLNFERADIREVIHSLASALGISYTIDPRIEGQVTIRTSGKISREDLFPLLNQILRNNGIAAVKVGDVYQVLPVAEAKTRAIIPRRPETEARMRETDSFEIEIVSLKHVSSDEMVNILQPFVTPGGDVLSYPRANVVVITDLHSNVERLRELAASFDTDVFHDLHTRVFKMKEGDPEELANELLGVLAPYGVTGTGDGEGGVYVVPLTRLNSLVVVAVDPSIFNEVERWLRMLDIPPEEGAGRQTFVYSVENAKAVDLAEVLNELFGGGGGGGGGLGRQPGAPPAGVGLFGAGGVSGGGGRGGLGGGRGGLSGARGGVGGGAAGQAGAAFGQQAAGQAGMAGGVGGAGGSTLGGGRGGRFGRSGGAGAISGAAGAPGQPGAAGVGGARGVTLPGGPAGAPGPGGAQGPPPIFKEEVRIVADEVTNSLVILATKRDYQLIVEVLRKIDVVPRQVVLEVAIAEVMLTKDFQFGIQYALAEGKLNQSIPDPNNVPDNTSIFRNGAPGQPVAGFLGAAVQRVPGAPAAFAVISDRDHFQIFINTIAARTNVKMLSAPYIIAADNREAHILVGNSIPILTSTQTSVLATSNIVNSVQYRDTGKILTVLPQVNSKGLVNMQIRQEVSDVGSQSFGNTNSPSFITREAETTVVVHDGESVLIGGIIDDTVRHDRSGIPFLMDIPVVGVAFRTDSDHVIRTELLLLITPYVIRTRDEARDVTEVFSSRQRGLNLYQLKRRAPAPRRLTPVEEPLVPSGERPAPREETRPRDVVSPEAAP